MAAAIQLDLFRWREAHITASVAQRFKRGLDEGYDAFEVFRAVQDHAANAARAHMDTVLVEAFSQAIDECEDPTVKDADAFGIPDQLLAAPIALCGVRAEA